MCAEDSAMERREFLRIGSVGLAGAVLLGTTGGRVSARTGSSLKEEFAGAARRYEVPVELLLAIGYVNTRWEMPPPEASAYEPGDLHGRGAYGIMQLVRNPWRDTLGKAANLTGLSEERLKTKRQASLRGGAAVLSDLAGAAKPSSLGGWYEAVAGYGEAELYAQEVFRTLEDGASATLSTGETLRLAPQEVEFPRVSATRSAAPDYPGAVWRPAYSGNYSNFNRERSHNIYRLVVHVAQGSVSSAVSWFQNPRANVSAHYVVGSEGGVVQCVRHEDVAWHAGNWSYNTHSIGIEHGGYAGYRSTWTERKYRASARLAAYCCRRHNIPVNRRYIVGHNEVPGATHSCPGRYFDYAKYLGLIRRYL